MFLLQDLIKNWEEKKDEEILNRATDLKAVERETGVSVRKFQELKDI